MPLGHLLTRPIFSMEETIFFVGNEAGSINVKENHFV